jgi:citrate synthase
MADEILFKITKEQLETGLRGFPAGYCPTSYVDPEKGLFYCDYPIEEVSTWVPEEVIFLLWHGYKGTQGERKKFIEDLHKRSVLRDETRTFIESLPKSGQPMKLLAIAILACGIFESRNHYREDCFNLIAKIPEIIAVLINSHAGWGKTPPAKPELGYMENFAQMLNVPGGMTAQLKEVLTLFNILHYDHGGGNLSTFVGKAVASGMEDLYGSIAASMTALAGQKHGGANQQCLAFVQETLDKLKEEATPKKIEDFIRNKLEKKELVYGFGHAVLRVEDPRATLFYRYATQHFPNHPLIKIALLLRAEGSKVLKENPKIADPYVNVDAISGTLLSVSGFPYPEYFTVLFGLSRTVGIAIQVVYERLEARGGKGTPIVRPKYLYKPRT